MKDSDSDSYDKNDMKEKVNDLIRLHKAMQEKLKTTSYSEKSKLLPWYLINGLKCTVQNTLMSLNTFSELHMKSKNVGGILAKTITTETLYLVTNAYEGGNFSR